MKLKDFFLYFVLFNLILFFYSDYASAQENINFSLHRDMFKGVKQVKVVFSEQIVSFGDIKGKGTRLDERTWIYDFDREFPAGVK